MMSSILNLVTRNFPSVYVIVGSSLFVLPFSRHCAHYRKVCVWLQMTTAAEEIVELNRIFVLFEIGRVSRLKLCTCPCLVVKTTMSIL
jgi:hypothetical protein